MRGVCACLPACLPACVRACVCACARSGPTLHLASQKSLSLPTGVHNNCGDCRKRQLTCPRHSPACCAGVFIQRCVCMLYREALGRVLFCAAKAVGTQECRLKCHLHSLDLSAVCTQVPSRVLLDPCASCLSWCVLFAACPTLSERVCVLFAACPTLWPTDAVPRSQQLPHPPSPTPPRTDPNSDAVCT